jgi:hypothetical protein
MALLNLYRTAILRARIAFHEVALRQIEPHHQDVPHIVLTLPVRDTMTDDRLNLHRVDTAQLGHDDGVSVGGCCTHECNEGRDCPQRIEFAGGEPVDWPFVAIVALILTVICVAAFSPEIAAFVYKISN